MSDLDELEDVDGLSEDWRVIESVLPLGWDEAARRTGAFIRARAFDGPSSLLRVLLIHLVDGCSLRETAVRARAGELACVSDVALLGRLRGSGEWFRWMAEKLSERLVQSSEEVIPGRRIQVVDATIVNEPGETGSTWRLHYSIQLSTLACQQVKVTPADDGETLARFDVSPGDVLMADRGLAKRPGIRHVVDHGGDIVIRMNATNVPLEDEKGRAFRMLPRLRKMSAGAVQSWPVVIRDERGLIPARLCALKKSTQATRESRKKLLATAKRKSRTLLPETIEMAGYVVVLTTMAEASAEQILELYRHRWQIELAFKRLKSLLHLGHLKKTDPVGARAWLQGKLFVAALIETLVQTGERFSPWGYQMPKGR